MIATREEMKAAKLDIGYRDFCAHLLIPLNACRRKSFFLPWKCEHERHVYEKCQYKEYVMHRLRRARGRWWASARVGARGLRRRSIERREEASHERRVYRTIERVMTDVACAYCLHRTFRYMKRVASMKDSKH